MVKRTLGEDGGLSAGSDPVAELTARIASGNSPGSYRPKLRNGQQRAFGFRKKKTFRCPIIYSSALLDWSKLGRIDPVSSPVWAIFWNAPWIPNTR